METLMFLAITGGLLISVMAVVGGQQQRADFRQSVQNIDSRIQDIINDVSSGYYTNTSDFKCVGVIPAGPNAGQPNITGGSNNQGTNEDCIFVGRVIQFAENGTNGKGYDVYTMVGRRKNAITEQEVGSIYEAKIIPIARGNTHTNVPPSVSATEINTLDADMSVTKMYHDANTASNQIGAVGFFSTFAKYGTLGIDSSSSSTNLLPIKGAGSVLNQHRPDMVDAMINYLNSGPATGDPAEINPAGGVTICFKSGATSQYAILTIGGNGRQLTTKVEIANANIATAPGAACAP